MDLSAILLTGKRTSRLDESVSAGFPMCGEESPCLASVELFGQSVLERTVERLRKFGVGHITVITSENCSRFRGIAGVSRVVSQPSECWTTAEGVAKQEAQLGVKTFLVAALGAYAEFDLSAALQFHRITTRPITPFRDILGPLPYLLVDAAHVESCGSVFSSLPENDGKRTSDCSSTYRVDGYVNRLVTTRDFRRLAVDGFLGNCSIFPGGREIKPGVWIEEGARVHNSVRLVAPVYIGRNTRVKAGAVITRCSHLERNCHIRENSLVYNASILAHTTIGRGLDVSSALVDGNDFVHFDRNISVRIDDPNLISNAFPRKLHIPSYLPQYENTNREGRNVELEYSQYLSRAAGRLLEVFKGEV